MFDPVTTFLARRRAAAEAGEPFDATAAVLATATLDGAPSARMILVKEVDADGFHFYTNRDSRKGGELAQNPRGALCFHFVSLGEQFRIEGPVTPASDARSDAYFATRPRESQLGAWAAEQSRPIDSRATLLARFDAIAGVHPDLEVPVPRPPRWGGYSLRPDRFEHWLNGAHRLHERRLFTRGAAGWQETLLAP